MTKITYRHRPVRGFFSGKPHRLEFDDSHISGHGCLDSKALVFLQSLKKRGSLGLEQAWDTWINSKTWLDGHRPRTTVSHGIDFCRKDDAMMFKMAFHGTTDFGYMVLIKRTADDRQ